MSVFDKELAAVMAFAKVSVAGGVLTVLNNRGFSAITRTGAGVVTVVREGAIPTNSAGPPVGAALPAAEVLAQVTLQGTLARSVTTVDEVDGITTTVRTFDIAGSPADSSFTITIDRPATHEVLGG